MGIKKEKNRFIVTDDAGKEFLVHIAMFGDQAFLDFEELAKALGLSTLLKDIIMLTAEKTGGVAQDNKKDFFIKMTLMSTLMEALKKETTATAQETYDVMMVHYLGKNLPEVSNHYPARIFECPYFGTKCAKARFYRHIDTLMEFCEIPGVERKLVVHMCITSSQPDCKKSCAGRELPIRRRVMPLIEEYMAAHPDKELMFKRKLVKNNAEFEQFGEDDANHGLTGA